MMSDIVPRDQVVKYGSRALGGVGGGVVVFILNAITRGGGFSTPGLIIGGAILVVGLLIGRSKEDRGTGMVATGAGLLTGIASLPLIGWLATGLLVISGVGLIGGGLFNLFKFIKGMRSRS
jgi:hypothetical protein